MRSSVIWSFLSLVALATGGLVTGCDSDASIAKSGVGQSCDSASDCDDGLVCLQNACYKSGSDIGGGEGGGEDPGVGPTPPVLGGPGESCTKRADCEDGLGCFAERCVEEPTGGSGAGPGGPTLGGIGETCGLTSDCSEGLSCVPQTDGQGPILKAIGSNSVGVCSPVNSGIEPTGKDCHAECAEAADCCELPVAYHQPYDAITYTYGTGANSCAQLEVLLDGVNCGAAVLTAINAARCFAQAAFCNCEEDTWACTDGACTYEGACEASGATPGGCPALSRTGRVLTQACNTDDHCAPEEAPAGCTTDASCTDKYVADSALTDICTAGECTCYKATGGCYRKCNADLDCRQGLVCDTTKVCVPGPECESDAQCAVVNGDFRFKCNTETSKCEMPCANDIDCNPFGITNGYLTAVCNADNRCEQIGCTVNDDCPSVGGVKTFCTDRLAPAGEGAIESAVTD